MKDLERKRQQAYSNLLIWSNKDKTELTQYYINKYREELKEFEKKKKR